MCLLLTLLASAPLEALATNVETDLTVGIQVTKTDDFRPLDPLERDMMSVYDLVYESLVRIDDNYDPQPYLAESWEVSGGCKTWTFKLRQDVFFSDGTPMTAHDVVATAQYILDRARDENSASRGYYQNLRYFVKSISASGDYTVVVKADRPYYGLLYAMTFPILKASEVGVTNPVGTGPYMVSIHQPYSYLFLITNSLWWQNQPRVREIAFSMYDTPRKVIEAYEYGQVETIFTRSIAAAQYKSGSSSLAISSRTNQLETLLMNQSYGKLKDDRVRLAIRYAVDPDKIAQAVYMGMVTRTDTPMIPGTWLYNNGLDSYFVRDLPKARALLAEAGWEDSNGDGILDRVENNTLVDLSMTLLVYEEPDNNVRYEAANMIADQLRQIGIDVSVSTVSYSDMLSKLSAGNYQLALASYAMDIVPDPGFMLISGNTGNYVRNRSDTMNGLFKTLRNPGASDLNTLRRSYQQDIYRIQQQFAEECPFICLYYRSGAILSRRMFTTLRDIREHQLLRGIESFRP